MPARPSGPDLQVIVVCNGCTDRTAQVAATFDAVTVVEVPKPSKRAAQIEGDRWARFDIRAYIDADVVITREDLERLAGAIRIGAVLAAAPVRRLDVARSSWIVRSYYRIWVQLPQVRSGLFGRGVVVLSPQGVSRVAALPLLMSDDLAMSESFQPDERQVIDRAIVVIHAPRTVADLVRRRSRVATGNIQMDSAELRTPAARTSVRSLIRVCRENPRLVSDLLTFLPITVASRVLARWRARAGDFATWSRDESSRAS